MTTKTQPIDFLEELAWRGLLHQCTDEQGLRDHLADPDNATRKAYCGFDPTADSLTIGNLVPIMTLIHFARAGHTPVVVMGGGTGLIGDPSGKTAERQLRTTEEIVANVNAQRGIFERAFEGADMPAPTITNNIDWLGNLGYIEALRDVGKHFSVNMMMQKESVKARLENREQGISYTEFSYMILQAYDFLRLYKDAGVTIQLGGSDQYGNIVAGMDLIRRIETEDSDAPSSAFGATVPLVTKADGTKFGKTESGAVWLTAPSEADASPNRTSAYAYYQFWLNASDEDVGKFLRIFTILPREEIESLEARHAEAPGKREAQRALARAATSILHGEEATQRAEAAAGALFSGDIADLDKQTLAEVFASVPSSNHNKQDLAQGADPIDLLVETGLAQSKRQAREFIQAGAVSINGRKLAEGDQITTDDLLHNETIAIRRGKKNWHATRWS